MTKQKLNLIEFAAGQVAQARAGPSASVTASLTVADALPNLHPCGVYRYLFSRATDDAVFNGSVSMLTITLRAK